MQFKRKLMNQTWGNNKKPNFVPDFAQIWASNFFSWVLPLLDVRHFRKLSSYPSLRKTYGLNSIKLWHHFGSDLDPWGSKLGCHSFLKSFAASVTRYHGQLSWCTISEKANDPILRKFSHRRANRQIDKRKWFHKTLCNWRRVSNTEF